MACHLAPVKLCFYLFIHVVPPSRNILPPPLCLTKTRGYLSKETRGFMNLERKEKAADNCFDIYLKKKREMTREIDKYLVEARQLRSVEHLVCTNLPLPPALLCGCHSTPGSLRFLIFCQVSYWVWCPSSPILPVFACFLSLPLTVSNKNFFQKHWCSHFI